MQIEKAYKRLLIEDPFCGIFLLGISKGTDYKIPTACVRRKGMTCELVVNPDYWETLNEEQQLNLLKHETYHLVFQHMLMLPSFKDHELFNIAADLEVNSYIPNPSKLWLYPTQFHLATCQGTKYYYETLSKNLPPNLNLYTVADDHSHWMNDFNDCSEAEKQLVQNQLNSNLINTADQVTKMRGTLPARIETMVQILLTPKPRIFDWKSYFRRMLGSIYDVNIRKTRRKESIRFPGAAGIKHRKKVSIMVAVDTSGSVSDKELNDFFSEITHIYRAGARITLVECDAQISAVYEYNGTWNGKIHGRGGTDFQPVIDYYRQNISDYSALVYFTDGYCSLPENAPRDIIWVITSNGSHQNYPGKTLYIPKDCSDE